ncbi:MAG: hypothetical protein JWQ09_3826 [Segetibacter sp.]|nr:hypothetical protein [Segetibacter sp.]
MTIAKDGPLSFNGEFYAACNYIFKLPQFVVSIVLVSFMLLLNDKKCTCYVRIIFKNNHRSENNKKMG